MSEKLAIVKRFLLTAPPGEVHAVLRDCRVLLADDALLTDTYLSSVFRELAMTSAPISGPQPLPAGVEGSKGKEEVVGKEEEMVVCRFGAQKEEGEGEILFPRKGGDVMLKVDYVKQTITSCRAATSEEGTPESVKPFRDSLEEHLKEYVRGCYPQGAVAVYGIEKGAKIELSVCISSQRKSPKNFWTGSWLSEWVIVVDPSGDESVASHDTRVLVHYFENGNVQLNSSTKGECKAKGKGAEAVAAAVVDAMRGADNEYLDSLDAAYGALGESTFKDLRRVLPVTRTHFPWETSAGKLAAELKGTSS